MTTPERSVEESTGEKWQPEYSELYEAILKFGSSRYKNGQLDGRGELGQEDSIDARTLYKMLTQALQTERQRRDEERANIPVGFLRQFLNERTPEEQKKLLTNEDIMRFINLGYDK